MMIELPALWIAVLNTLGIPALHLLLSWLSLRLPDRFFALSVPTPPPAPAALARSQKLATLVGLRRWKAILPDAAPWLGGSAKKLAPSASPPALRALLTETRRGFFSHLLQLPALLIFLLWTPAPYALIIIAYALLSNLPCLLNLHHTSLRLQALLARHSRK
ncbi:MAG: hypothetical protein ACQKBY_11310 [Verrucomicrobiales bacterium]